MISYDIVAKRLIVYVIIPWLLFRFILEWATGISISYINPLRLRIVGISIRGKVRISSLQFNPFEKKVLIRGVNIVAESGGVKSEPSIKSEASGLPKGIPVWLKNQFFFMLKRLDGLHIVFFDTLFEDAGLLFGTMAVVVRYDKIKNGLSVSLFMSRVKFEDDIICEDALFILQSTVARENVKTGNPFQNLVMDFKIGDLTVSMDTINKMMRSERNVTKHDNGTEASVEIGFQNLQSALEKIRLGLNPIRQVTVSIDKILLKNIPMTSHPELIKLNEYLTYNIYAASFTFNAVRFKSHMPGFKLTFKDHDTPFKFNTTLSSFSISMNMTRKCISSETQLLKVLETPNVSLFGSTNLFSQKFNYEKETALENAICTLKGHISSPTVDIDVDHLSFFKCFRKNIKVFTGALEVSSCLKGNEGSSILRDKKILINYIKVLVPLIDVKLTLEDPKIVISDHSEFLIHKFSALMLDYKTNRSISVVDKKQQVNYDLNFGIEMLSLKSQHLNKDTDYKRTIVMVESVAIRNVIKIEPEPIFCTQADIDTLQIDLSELPTMIMVNNIFRKLDSQILDVEQNYFMHYYEKFAERLKSTERRCSKIGKEMKCLNLLPSNFLFLELPSIFDYLKVDLRDVTVTLGARSLFMPPCVFSNVESQSPEDLVHGKLRKYFHKTDKLQLALFGNRTQWHSRIDTGRTTMVKSAQNSSYNSDHNEGLDDISTSDSTEVEHLWNFNVLVNNMSSTVVSETPEEADRLSERKVSMLSVLSLKIFPDTESFDNPDDRKIIVQIDNKRIKSVISLMNVFLVISGIHTLKQIFGRDVCSHRKESLAKKHFLAVSLSKKKSFFHYVEWKELKELIQLNFSSEHINQIMVLPNGLTTRLETTSTFVTVKNLSQISISGLHFRMCVESPLRQNYWVRMMTIIRYCITIDSSILKEQMESKFEDFDSILPGIVLENESWHFSIPHKFEMYRIFDNISTILKSMRQMIHSFKTSKNDMIMFPHSVKTPSFPKVKLKSKRCTFSIDDDPFEAELNTIFQIGLEEQKSRVAKMEELERHTAAELLKAKKSHYSKTELVSKECDILARIFAIRKKFKIRRATTSPELAELPYNTEEQDKAGEKEQLLPGGIEDAYHRLLENFSTSWINRINQCKQKQQEAFEKNFSFIWGNVDFRKLPPEFNQKVLPFSTDPFLTNLIIEDIDIDVFHPSCGIDGIPEFINRVGKGVPKDTDYSIMIPMYLDAKFKEIRWHLKDYPLPFVYIPSLMANQSDEPNDIRIYGNFIITEDMFRSESEIRTVFVPLVPSVTEGSDSYYSLSVPRTLTSVKIFSDLQFDINSKDTTQVTWGGGYQPAIQQTMQCLDNFSKPPIDPSPKLGFWDKIRYLFHARIRISWKNNGKFEVSLKGGKSPYKIGADATGFIVGFAGGVLLKCNEDDDPQKFLSCTAEQVHFSIPNYFAKPLLVWSQSSDMRVFIPSHNDTNLQEYASFYYLLPLETTRGQANEIATMSSYYIEKTGISLTGGITLNVGIVLERLLTGAKERTLSFEPHYDARLCNPIHVVDKSKYDSYAGFRSDFIHLSFTLLSSSDDAYNTMQLSPAGLKTFMVWWKSFAGNFPVRRGPLFGLQSISPKFGEHLFTISYHAEASPLFITHIAHSIDTTRGMKDNHLDAAEFAGLKAKAEHFVMDLHQRKEVMLEYQEQLDKTKKVMRLKFLEGDVSTLGIDIRAIEATLKRLKYVEEKEDANFDIFDDDMGWYDITDFKEAYFVDVDDYVPHVKIRPLLFSPQFVYQKRASYGDKFQVDPQNHKRIKPFRNSLSHNCTLGGPLVLPFEALQKRSDILKEFREKIQHRLQNGEENNKPCLEKKLRKTNTAIEKVQCLVNDFETLGGKQAKENNQQKFYYPTINMLQDSAAAAKTFENRYHVCNMLLKWNEGTRDVVYKFLHFLRLTRQLSSLSPQKSSQLFEEIVKQRELPEEEREAHANDTQGRSKFEEIFTNSNDEDLNEALQDIFEKVISELGCQVEHTVHNNHLVHFVTPQIQLITEEDPDSCIIVTAPSIKLKVLSFDGSSMDGHYDEDTFLKRYGLLLTNANIFYFHKDAYKDYFEVFFDISAYGQSEKSQWPPWLGMELCFEPETLASEAIIKDLSSVLFYERVFQFASVYNLIKDTLQNKISGYIPQIVLSSDSRSYMTLYKLVTSLLIYIEPENAELQGEIEKLSIGLDPEDISQMLKIMVSLNKRLEILRIVEQEFLFKRQLLDDVGAADLVNLRSEKVDNLLRLYILMKVFSSNRSWTANADHKLLWDFHFKEIILHMLDANARPFLDVAVATLHFERLESSIGFNNNRVTVHMAQVFDLQECATYKNLLGPLYPQKMEGKREDDQPLIYIIWEMNKPVGGIKVIKNVETNIKDLSLSLEDETIHKAMEWFIPNELNSLSSRNKNEEGFDSTSTINDSEDTGSDRNVSHGETPDLDEMIQRSTDYVIIENLVLNSFKLCISFKGKGAKRIINVTNFIFAFPMLTFENQTMRIVDLLIELRKALLRDLLKHTGKFIGTKMKNRPHDNQPKISSPLKQLSHYDSYTKVEDLRE